MTTKNSKKNVYDEYNKIKNDTNNDVKISNNKHK